MPDQLVPTSSGVSDRMRRQGTRNTRPELALRRLLHSHGLRYRLGRPVPGYPRRTIDISFPKERVAVFVDGCFWHRCPEHGTDPKANKQWWARKLDQNVTRDAETDAHLAGCGWVVIRIWEHEDPQVAARRVELAVRSRRGASPSVGASS